jgi:homoserine O-acetyltransferase
MHLKRTGILAGAALILAVGAHAQTPRQEGDYVIRNFQFRSGETLPELKIHYLTLGAPARDAKGNITNAVLIMHGTGGTGRQFLNPAFASVLYGPGAALDTTRMYLILRDGIGHGKSSKPSDGLRMKFPKYDYDDMVLADYRLLTEHLGVKHLRLVMGTSMGGMHSWVWGETYPDFMDALMPLACQPVAIVGRNRLWRSMVVDAIKNDPEWKNGDYTSQPKAGLRTAIDFLVIAGSAPMYMQQSLADRDTVDKYLARQIETRMAGLDANDLIYQIEASRNYDPSAKLGVIKAPVMFVNSADDFINPPELGIAEREIKKVAHAKFVLIPSSVETRGHGTHTWAKFWVTYLDELLKQSARPGTAGSASKSTP